MEKEICWYSLIFIALFTFLLEMLQSISTSLGWTRNQIFDVADLCHDFSYAFGPPKFQKPRFLGLMRITSMND